MTRSASGHDLIVVALGGATGSLLRYLGGALLPVSGNLSTFLLNVVGAFALGWIATAPATRTPRRQLLLGTGLCGGFTTYSALAVGVAELSLTGGALTAAALAAGTVACAAAATVAGIALANAARLRAGRESTRA